MRPQPDIILDDYRFAHGRLGHGVGGIIVRLGDNGNVGGDENSVPDGYASPAPDMKESRNRATSTDADLLRMFDDDRMLYAETRVAAAQHAAQLSCFVGLRQIS